MLIAEVVHDALGRAGEGLHEALGDCLEAVAVTRGRARAQLGLQVAVEPLVGFICGEYAGR